MKLQKSQRAKALRMIDNWSDSYVKELNFHKEITQEYNETPADGSNMNALIERLHEIDREMHILLRMQQLTLNLRAQPRVAARLDRLITRFFQARKLYSEQWGEPNALTSKIMGYLKSIR